MEKDFIPMKHLQMVCVGLIREEDSFGVKGKRSLMDFCLFDFCPYYLNNKNMVQIKQEVRPNMLNKCLRLCMLQQCFH